MSSKIYTCKVVHILTATGLFCPFSVLQLQHPPWFLLAYDICSSQPCLQEKAAYSRCACKLTECHNLGVG